jgi:hypothetical protein
MTRFSPATLTLLTLALVGLVSCKSSPKKGLPKNLPKINVKSSAAPPKHNMNRGEYPFDERGNYIAAWAAEGSRGGGNIPAPQVETPVELPSPEPERPTRSQSRSSRMVVSSAPPPMPQPDIPPPPSRPAPTPVRRLLLQFISHTKTHHLIFHPQAQTETQAHLQHAHPHRQIRRYPLRPRPSLQIQRRQNQIRQRHLL